MAKTTFAISDEIRQLSGSIVAKDNPTTQVLAVRTSVAAVVSYLIARLFRLAEAYWAPISAGIGVHSTLGAALPVSMQHFARTVIAAAVRTVQSSCWLVCPSQPIGKCCHVRVDCTD